ncbi:MAG: DNA-directed RNA polymerase subunit E'' [Methanosphaera sp. rholeuAM74]|nr:MAG: DNA-directed RNA polymerase subunit E'' [Methanosphaera sp. rholeuAM74]
MAEKACPRCRLITFNEQCPLCQTKTSEHWTGLIVVVNPDDSDLARELNITTPGRYALKVRE